MFDRWTFAANKHAAGAPDDILTGMPLADETTRWRRFEPTSIADVDLRALRALLAGFTEAAICRNLNIASLDSYSLPRPEALAATLLFTDLDFLLRLFYQGGYATEDALPPDMLALLLRLGLVARDSRRPGSVYATAGILRVAGELIVCDRGGAPDGSPYPLLPDVVYPPIFDNVRLYLATLPSTPCDAMLEIGCGTGIGAILGAKHAHRVWATDIASRAVGFAHFNGLLAGLDNLTALCGDLYTPVNGLTFDRIAIHPPWVPDRQSKFVFGSGGEDGEAIIAGAIAGLPQFLRPGGRFYAAVLASDRAGERLEERVRRWLGVEEQHFDIAFGECSRLSPHEFLAQNVARGSIAQADVPSWSESFRVNRAEALVYGQLLIERQKVPREPVTVRTQAGQDYSGRHLEKWLDRT